MTESFGIRRVESPSLSLARYSGDGDARGNASTSRIGKTISSLNYTYEMLINSIKVMEMDLLAKIPLILSLIYTISIT